MKKTSSDTTQPKYPMLAKRQKKSTIMERKVRRLLNQQTDQGDREAWKILSAIQPQKRGAEWYFLSGCLRHRMGYYTDADAYLDTAIRLSNGKVEEYIHIKEKLNTPEGIPSVSFNFQDAPPMSKGEMCGECAGECFIEGCAECCGTGCCEGCTEGCATGCCEGCCDGCDCG